MKMAQASTGKIQVRAARTARDRKQFLEFPYRLYRNHPYWVPPLRIAQKDILNTERHPFYKTSDVEMFLAEREGRIAGRIMAIHNHAHNEFHNERAGFFGFFEVEDDLEAAAALFEAASDWLSARGATVLRGPVNPSTNYELGLLVEGFDSSPAVMMTYNLPYYASLIEACGFAKAVDLYAYEIDAQYFIVSDKLKRVSERLRTRDKITVRTVNLKNFEQEVKTVRQIYNDAWSNNWGFVPVSEDEFTHLAKDMKQIINPEIVLIAEQQVEGRAEPRPIGFFLSVPDINIALKKINGRLLPFGLFKLLWHTRKIRYIRIITMGIIKQYQNLGAAAVFYDEIYRRGPAKGFASGEMSWVLENNALMLRAAEMIGGRKSKTYRIYEKSLQPQQP